MKKLTANLLLIPAIMIVFPTIAFFAVNFVIPLEAKTYAVASLAGFYAIIITLTFIITGTQKMKNAIIYNTILMLTVITGAFILFSFIVPLTQTDFAGAIFGAFFSVCIAIGFKLIKETINQIRTK